MSFDQLPPEILELFITLNNYNIFTRTCKTWNSIRPNKLIHELINIHQMWLWDYIGRNNFDHLYGYLSSVEFNQSEYLDNCKIHYLVNVFPCIECCEYTKQIHFALDSLTVEDITYEQIQIVNISKIESYMTECYFSEFEVSDKLILLLRNELYAEYMYCHLNNNEKFIVWLYICKESDYVRTIKGFLSYIDLCMKQIWIREGSINIPEHIHDLIDIFSRVDRIWNFQPKEKYSVPSIFVNKLSIINQLQYSDIFQLDCSYKD